MNINLIQAWYFSQSFYFYQKRYIKDKCKISDILNLSTSQFEIRNCNNNSNDKPFILDFSTKIPLLLPKADSNTYYEKYKDIANVIDNNDDPGSPIIKIFSWHKYNRLVVEKTSMRLKHYKSTDLYYIYFIAINIMDLSDFYIVYSKADNINELLFARKYSEMFEDMGNNTTRFTILYNE